MPTDPAALLRQRGIQVTAQRLAVFRAVGNQPHITADGVAEAINRLLQNLVLKCAKAEGVRDYFHVGILSYGGEVKSGLGGKLAGQFLVPISQIVDFPRRPQNYYPVWAD